MACVNERLDTNNLVVISKIYFFRKADCIQCVNVNALPTFLPQDARENCCSCVTAFHARKRKPCMKSSTFLVLIYVIFMLFDF